MKKKSSLPSPSAVAEIDTHAFSKVFQLKKGILETVPALPDKEAIALPFKSEAELASLVAGNRAVLFGERIIGLSGRLDSASFPWYALLFDFTGAKPRCYMLVVMIANTPTTTVLCTLSETFTYMEKPKSRDILVNALRTALKTKAIARAFEQYLGKEPSTEDLGTLTKRWKCLFITDTEPHIMGWFKSAFAHSWTNLLEVVTLQKCRIGKECFVGMHPASVQPEQVLEKAPREKVTHDEAHHLSKGAAVVQSIYKKLKTDVSKIAPRVEFNPKGKHYIAMKVNGGKNLAFFHFRKNCMYLVIKLDEKIVRKALKKNRVVSLPGSVQKFWNGASTGLVVDSMDHLKEVVELFKKLIK